MSPRKSQSTSGETQNMKARIIAVIALVAVLVAPLAAINAQGGKTIVDIAVENGNFTTLVAAVQAAGLVETLQSAGPFTVFRADR